MNATIERGRITSGPMASDESYGFNGAFELQIRGEHFRVVISDGMGWKHVSVSKPNQPNRVPNWEVMCEIKNLFFGEDEWVCQFHPPKSEYVNNHAGCLHLWSPTDQKLPVPDSILTGIKGATKEEVKAVAAVQRLRGFMLVDSQPNGMGGKLLEL